MLETISLEQLPFKFDLLEKMKNDGLTIKCLKAEFSDYYYLTSSSIHRVYSFNGESHILLTDFHMSEVMEALDNPAFAKKVTEYLGTTQTV